MNKKLTTLEFTDRANIVHQNRYSYDNPMLTSLYTRTNRKHFLEQT